MFAAKVFALLATLTLTSAQIPSLGWCPDYQAMADFNMNKFLGQWHEAERYFTVTELGSRCVTTNYEKMPDGRVWVSNEIRNAFTGVRRVLDGQLQVVGRDGEGKLSVKYASLPVPYDTQYSILDTDYTSYAVVWSCSGIGPVHTQNAWIMTRERLAPGLVLQRAYGVLDKYKISRAFFVKTNQADCTIQPAPIEAVDPTPAPVEKPTEKPAQGKDAVGSVIVPEVPQQEKKNEAIVPKAKEPVKQEAKLDAIVTPPAPSKAPVSVPELILSNAGSPKLVLDEVSKPILENPKPVEVVHKPSEDIKKPEPLPEKPVEAIQHKSVNPIVEPERHPIVTKPVENQQNRISGHEVNHLKAAAEEKPVINPPKPSEVSKPIEHHKPEVEPPKPSLEVKKPLAEIAKPAVIDDAKPQLVPEKVVHEEVPHKPEPKISQHEIIEKPAEIKINKPVAEITNAQP